MSTENKLNKRWFYLVAGVLAMLFSGVLYAWSIFSAQFIKEGFGFGESTLSLNFTLTMCFFCLGAFFGSLICKKIGVKITLIISGLLCGAGFVSTGLLSADSSPWLLYITYALLAGTGIGISYNVVVSTVCSWFPDRKGFCSGCLMMGFGISTLIMGKAASALFESPTFGMSKTYMLIGGILAAVLVVAGIILRKPTADDKLPSPKAGKTPKKSLLKSEISKQRRCLKASLSGEHLCLWRSLPLSAIR